MRLLSVFLCGLLLHDTISGQMVLLRRKKIAAGSTIADKGVEGTTQGDIDAPTIASPAMNTAIGDLVVCGVKWEGATTANSAADTAGNTYSALTAGNNSGSNGEPHVRIFYTIATAGNASNVVTITFSSATPWRRLGCRLFTGVTAYDSESTVGQATSGTAIATGSITTSAASVIFAIVGGYTSNTYSSQTIGGVTSTFGTHVSDTRYHFRITTGSQSAITANVTQSASDRWTTIAASFK